MLEMILGNVWSIVALVGAVITAVIGIYAKGRKDAANKRTIEDLENEKDTRDALDNVDIPDLGSANEFLHERINERDL